jgi:hypothetical protein
MNDKHQVVSKVRDLMRVSEHMKLHVREIIESNHNARVAVDLGGCTTQIRGIAASLAAMYDVYEEAIEDGKA